MRWLVFSLAFAACQPVPSIPERPLDAAYVQYGNGGSITGGGVITTIYANNQLYRRYTSPVPGEGRTEWQQLPEGAFSSIKAVAIAGLAKLSVQTVPQACLDAGVDRLAVVDSDGVVSQVERRCPDAATDAAFDVLRAEVGRQISAAQDQVS